MLSLQFFYELCEDGSRRIPSNQPPPHAHVKTSINVITNWAIVLQHAIEHKTNFIISCLNQDFLLQQHIQDNSHATKSLALHCQLHNKFCRVVTAIFGSRERQYKGGGEGFNDEFIYHVCHVIWHDVWVEVVPLTMPPMQLLYVSIWMLIEAKVVCSTPSLQAFAMQPCRLGA